MQVPVYIVNRDRLTCTKKLIDWLLAAGTERIVILDNDSTYPPCLDYYQQLPAGVELQLIGRNGGPWIFWELKMWTTISTPYIVTDSDLVPADVCPKNLVEKLQELFPQFPKRSKIGPGIRIDNIPDVLPFKKSVVDAQAHYWQDRLSPECFSAPIDTTFALYRAGSEWADSMPHTGVRLDNPYVVEHWPWYSWPLTEEDKWYCGRAMPGLSNFIGYVEEALNNGVLQNSKEM